MSADNWTVCPRCLARAREKAEILFEKARASYGKVPIETFEKLTREAEDASSLKLSDELREDYELHMDGLLLNVRYTGRCHSSGNCGFYIEYKKEIPIKDIEVEPF